MVIGSGTLSEQCLSCQGAVIDCASQQLKQQHCYEPCLESSCSKPCRACLQAFCSIQSACGGVPGETVQWPRSCPDPSKPSRMMIDFDLLRVAFTGSCAPPLRDDAANGAHGHQDVVYP
eukprot:TRINITY_DN23654_c1_g1_i7.p1 TRINITY_DN23654_c1_g1~~TRINITY_DN23654_c1_g1_i7.p1  ORF type:complete len:119 (+),score=11.17 TRINITY_DN23654_c1_g1_i7:335-691(+)